MPPSFRPDIAIEEDLIEEIGRYIGYNNSPGELPGKLPRRAELGSEMSLAAYARNLMMSRGYTEVMTYSFLPENFVRFLKLDENDLRARPLLIANPISRDQVAMRTTLIMGLLNGLKKTISSTLFKNSGLKCSRKACITSSRADREIIPPTIPSSKA